MLQNHGTTDRLEKLATGASAEVYAWQPGQVIKLFRRDFPREALELELRHARIAHALGVPTPRVDGVVELNGRTGIVFERVDGPTLLDLIQAGSHPVAALARQFFSVQQSIHRSRCSDLQPLHARLARRAAYARDVPASLKNEAIGILQAAPAVHALCHGDFHPVNVIMAARGTVVVDWLDAACGDPALDVTRTMLFLTFARPGQVAPEARAAFLQNYSELCREAWSGRLDELRRWTFAAAVARLAEAVDATERQGLMALVERRAALWP